MTTERSPKAKKAAPRLDLSGSEWKLYVAAVLGIAYTASFLAMDGPAPPPVRRIETASPQRASPTTVQARARPPAPRARIRLRTRSS